MENAKGLFLCMHNEKDCSDTPRIYDMERGFHMSFGQNCDTVKSVGVVQEGNKRGIKFLFIHGNYEKEEILFVGDIARFYYSYTEITGPTDWEDVDIHIYFKLIEK